MKPTSWFVGSVNVDEKDWGDPIENVDPSAVLCANVVWYSGRLEGWWMYTWNESVCCWLRSASLNGAEFSTTVPVMVTCTTSSLIRRNDPSAPLVTVRPSPTPSSSKLSVAQWKPTLPVPVGITGPPKFTHLKMDVVLVLENVERRVRKDLEVLGERAAISRSQCGGGDKCREDGDREHGEHVGRHPCHPCQQAASAVTVSRGVVSRSRGTQGLHKGGAM